MVLWDIGQGAGVRGGHKMLHFTESTIASKREYNEDRCKLILSEGWETLVVVCLCSFVYWLLQVI